MIYLASIRKNESVLEKDESKRDEVQKLNEKALMEKEKCLQQINQLTDQFKDDKWGEVIQKIREDSNRFLSNDEWNKFNEVVKMNTSAMFREQNKLLQEMKAEKKKITGNKH